MCRAGDRRRLGRDPHAITVPSGVGAPADARSPRTAEEETRAALREEPSRVGAGLGQGSERAASRAGCGEERGLREGGPRPRVLVQRMERRRDIPGRGGRRG